MIRTTNFRRAGAFVLAFVVLCFCVLRPVTVYATGAEAAAMAGVVGIAPEVAVPIILGLLGIAYIGANWDTICALASDVVDSFSEVISGEKLLPAYDYNGSLYISQACIDEVAVEIEEYYSYSYKDAWELGKNLSNMYTLETTNPNHYLVVWSNYTIGGNNQRLTITNPSTIYEYNEGQVGVYDYTATETNYALINLAPDELASTTVQSSSKVLNPTYGEMITVVTSTYENVAPIARTATTSYVDTKTEVEVITSTDTGTGSTTVELSGILGWLQKIWIAITELVSGITTPIKEALAQVKTVIGNIGNLIQEGVLSAIGTVTTAVNTGVQTIGDAIATVKTGVISLVDFFTGTTYVASPLEAIHFGSLFDLFPFNIPAGIVEAVRFWGSTAAAPTIKIPLPTVTGGAVDIYEFEINFSEIPAMDKLAAIIRAGELILFVVGLAILTEKVTKW